VSNTEQNGRARESDEEGEGRKEGREQVPQKPETEKDDVEGETQTIRSERMRFFVTILVDDKKSTNCD
jgi:hypothetical protein